MSGTVLVAAGVLIEGGRVLVSRRKKGTHLAGVWEFPGGKIEADEDPREALVRELREEIGIDIVVGAPIEVTSWKYPEKRVLLLFFACARTPQSPEPRAIEVDEVQWVDADELASLELPPADVPVVRAIERILRG